MLYALVFRWASSRNIQKLIQVKLTKVFNGQQAPFFPQEAEKKGANATEYGLVFGVFELIVFMISPIYGQYLNKIGPKVSHHVGAGKF